ncbi:MAG: hypothetical protein M3Y76_13470 [Chloroflexota bacterium]|nr:hypothetical protein [Chloroflexota bacterium]
MKKMLMSVVVLVCLGVLASCGSTPSAPQAGVTTYPSRATTAPSTAMSQLMSHVVQPTAHLASVSFTVTSVALSVNPTSIAGKTCGSFASFTYTAIFHIPAHTAGGTIQFAYTLNNGRSQTSGSVRVVAGETSKTFRFVSSGTLSADHTYPGTALVMVTSPNHVISPSVKPSGTCVGPAPFQVTAVSMTVNPSSIQGLRCGTSLTVTYTALFHLVSNGPGGTIQFAYTVNNGRGSTMASITVAPGQTTASYSFLWSGNLPADHTYPEVGGVIVQSPNAMRSSLLGPSGTCS